jgi:5-aminolevulinate synthase
MFDYTAFFDDSLAELRRERRYRVFRELRRHAGRAPRAELKLDDETREVVVWCGNDYLGMSQHEAVREGARAALERCGAGAGGTRNISGTLDLAVELEAELAALHGKPSGLLFSSGYVANDTTLATLGARLPGCVMVSDAENHASMIEGMRRSGAERKVFAHNDVRSLRRALAQSDPARPRIVAIESLYSMSGDIAPAQELLTVAREYGALTYVDETHAVGVYGSEGGGLLAAHGLCDLADIIQGGLGKGYGAVGGFITGGRALIDFVRSHAPGFIFTTALPPAALGAALASVRHLAASQTERTELMRRVAGIRDGLLSRDVPLMSTRSQILPLPVGDAASCTAFSERLLRKHGIYLQPINHPSVPRGTERLRLTPSPLHDDAMSERLVDALQLELGGLTAVDGPAQSDRRRR